MSKRGGKRGGGRLFGNDRARNEQLKDIWARAALDQGPIHYPVSQNSLGPLFLNSNYSTMPKIKRYYIADLLYLKIHLYWMI